MKYVYSFKLEEDQYEDFIVIEYINVVALIDEMEYDIELNLSVPSLNVYGLSLKTALNNDGYIFT